MLFFLLSLTLAGDVSVFNDYLELMWSIDNNNVLSTKEIINKRTDGGRTTVVPQPGSEEFIISLEPTSDGKEWPNPINNKDWTITANSEQNDAIKEGPAKYLLDGDRKTLWHSYYSGTGGHDDRDGHKGPFFFIVDTKKTTVFKGLSYLNRQVGVNGIVRDFQLYISETNEDIREKIKKGEFELEGTFEVNHDNKCYICLTKELSARFIAIKTDGDGMFASGAMFELYDTFPPVTKNKIKSSELKLQSYDIKDNNKEIIFRFKRVKILDINWEINQIVKIEADKHYLHKYLQIRSDNDDVYVTNIELQHIVISENDLKNSWGTPMIESTLRNLGQPLYINTLFTACRFPLAHTLIESRNIGHVRYCSGKKFSSFKKDENNYYNTWQVVLGAARSERIEVVRSDFFSYISDISVSAPFRKQYNSWYDWMLEINEVNIMKSFKEIERGCSQYGIGPLDSYVVDDGWNNYNYDNPKYHVYDTKISGTTYNKDGFWTFNNKFPNKFHPPSNYTRKISSNFGVWLGPRGGYITQGQFGHLIEEAGNGYYSEQSQDVDVASHKYIMKLKELLISFIKEFKVNYYKLDGFTTQPCTNANHDHVVGGEDGVYFYTDMWEHYFEAYQEMIDTAKEVGIDNFWISTTSYANCSPFHLQWSNSLWVQISGDLGTINIGGNKNYADQMLTYRDDIYWQFYNERQYQVPSRNLYNHDPIYGQANTPLRNSMDDDYFRTFLMGCVMRGTAFFELYYTYDMLDEGDKWYVNSDVLSFAEKNFETLQYSQRFGGRPGKGEVYGYSSWNRNDGFIALRNPGGYQTEFFVVLDRNIGVPEGITKVYRSTKLSHRTTATSEIINGVEFKYADTLKVVLQPGEFRIYEFHEKIDDKAPIIECLKSVGENEINIRFDKYVDLSKTVFTIEGLTINEKKLRGDLRTVTLKTSPMKKNTIYTLEAKEVANIFGFKQDIISTYEYFAENTITSIRGEFTGNENLIMGQNVSTDTFSFRINIKDYQNVKSGVILHSKDNSIRLELIEGKLKFTVGKVSTISESIISNDIKFIMLVRERNSLIKIYLNSEIDSSAFNKEMPIVETLHDIILGKSDIVYTCLEIFNQAFSYSQIPSYNTVVLGENKVHFNDNMKSLVYVGSVVGIIVLTAIVVISILSKKRDNQEVIHSTPLISRK